MFYVYEEGIRTNYVVGGATTLSGAKELATNRAKQELTWKSDGFDYIAVIDHVTYQTIYRIEPGKGGNG